MPLATPSTFDLIELPVAERVDAELVLRHGRLLRILGGLEIHYRGVVSLESLHQVDPTVRGDLRDDDDRDGWQVAAVAERVNPDAPARVRVLCRVDAQRP